MAHCQVQQTVRRRKEEKSRESNVKAYLCGSAPVQNILLELRAYQRRYAASASPTEVPEEGGVSKGPGRMAPGGCTSAFSLRQTPPLREALGDSSESLSTPDMRLSGLESGGDACGPLGKNGSES